MKPSIKQIQEVVKISESIQNTLETIGSDLPKQTLQISINWIQYFQSVELQFKQLRKDYSEVLIVCYSNYINEVYKYVSNLQNEASELNEAVNSFNFIDAYTKISREIQGIIDFINFLQSFPFDFNKSISKSLTILEKIISANKSKYPDEINRIIRLIKKIIENENMPFDEYDKTQKKLIKIRTKLYTLFEKTKKKKICKAFNFISLACYHFFTFEKPASEISASLFKFLFNLLSFSVNLRNITADKPGKNIDLYKWSQNIIENIQTYASIIKDYNEPESTNENEAQFNAESKEKGKEKLRGILVEIDEMIEAGKGHGFDKLISKLENSKEEIIEQLKIETTKTETVETENNDDEEKRIVLSGDSIDKKEGYNSVYSSFYSDDFYTKFTKSPPSNRPKSQYVASPLLLTKNGQPSTFGNSQIKFSDSSVLESDLSLSDFHNSDSHSRRNQKRKLTSSHSLFHLSPKNNSLSSSSFNFRVSSRKPILIDSESPIKIKPSGRHLTFLLPNEDDDFEIMQKNSQKPSISPYPENIDPDLLIPFIPNPPFAGWVVSYLLQKVTFSTLPTINYHSKTPEFNISIYNFHLPPIKQLIEDSNEESDYLTSEEEKDKNKNKSKNKIAIDENENDDKKSKSKKKKKPLIHFRKKKKEEKNGKDHDRGSPKKKHWFKKSEMDKKSAAVIKQINISLRKCWKNLRNAKNKNDQYGRFQIVSEWYKTVYSYVPTLVNYSKDFPNNEFIVDAVREYERIRNEFDDILNEIEFIKGQTMVESIRQSAKQLSLILVALDIYINGEYIQNKTKLQMASKIMGYLANILYNLQIIVDCSDPSSFIACSEFITNIWCAINEFYPVFNDLESFVKKSILIFAVKSILLTLKPAVVLLYQIDNNKSFSHNLKDDKSSNETSDIFFTDQQIQDQVSYLKKVSLEFLNQKSIASNSKLYVTMVSDLFKDLINLPSFFNPLFITDLNEIGNVVESTFIEMQLQAEKDTENNDDANYDFEANKSITEEVADYEKEVLTTPELHNCMTVLAAIRKLQFMLTVRLGNEFQDIVSKSEDESNKSDDSSSKQISHNVSYDSDTSNIEEHHLITNNEFVRLVTQNECDFSELADLIQMNSVLYNSSSLQVLTKNWFDSIYQITFAFVDLLKVSPILNRQPYLYSQVGSFYELLFDSILFFKNTVKAKINVSSILDHLMANIKHTQYYSKVKPFCITMETIDEDPESKIKKKDKKNKENESSDSNEKEEIGLDKFKNSPLFEPLFDFEKYKCGFFVNKVPIYKRAIFADFIQSVITKLREPHQYPQKTMDYLATFFTQVFNSIINISQQLQKDEEKEAESKKEKGKDNQNEKDNDNDKSKNNSASRDYFLMLLINRERDNVLHLRYSEESSVLHYGVENKNKFVFLLSLGEFLAKYFELAAMLSDDTQKIIETRKKNGRKKRRKKSKKDANGVRKRRGRVDEVFSLDNSSEPEKITDSDFEDDNENDNEDSNSENNSKTESDNYSNNTDDDESSDKNNNFVISKEAKSKLKELRQYCKATIYQLKKISKKLSKSIIQPFNNILRTKPATVKSLLMSSQSLSQSFIVCLKKIQDDLKAEKETEQKIKSNNDSNDDKEDQKNSIIISRNESSVDENENDLKWIKIKESFDSIISSINSIKRDVKSSIQNETKKQDESDDSENCTAGVFFEQIYLDIKNIPVILESAYDKAARLFSKIEQKIAKYAQKSLVVPYSELLTSNLIDQFATLLKTIRNRYLQQHKLIEKSKANSKKDENESEKENDDDDDENELDSLHCLIMNDVVNSQFEALQKTSKILLQRELIEKSKEPELLLMILSQKIVEEAVNFQPSSEDYSFVLKTILNLAIAVLNAYAELNKEGKNKSENQNNTLNFESLKMFVASFDYFIEILMKEMDNEILSDEMIHVIHEFEKLNMHIPGYFAPRLCLRFLLIEADNDDDDDDE